MGFYTSDNVHKRLYERLLFSGKSNCYVIKSNDVMQTFESRHCYQLLCSKQRVAILSLVRLHKSLAFLWTPSVPTGTSNAPTGTSNVPTYTSSRHKRPMYRHTRPVFRHKRSMYRHKSSATTMLGFKVLHSISFILHQMAVWKYPNNKHKLPDTSNAASIYAKSFIHFYESKWNI